MENKYGPIYTETQVGPLIGVVRRLVTGKFAHLPLSADPENRTLNEVLAHLNAAAFPAEEPMFLLRGQDRLAPAAVLSYANFVRETEGAFGEGLTKAEALDGIEMVAAMMANWTPRKLPD